MQINIQDYPEITKALLQALAKATNREVKDVPREFVIPLMTSLCKKFKAVHEFSQTMNPGSYAFDLKRDLSLVEEGLKDPDDASAKMATMVIDSTVSMDIKTMQNPKR
jgi:hypothetical protein